jgi:hypothetical protein
MLVPFALAVACRGHSEGTSASPFPSSESAAILGAETRAHAMGELAVAPDYNMSVDSDRECLENSPFASKHGHVKLGIEVSIEGTSAVEVPVNPFYATLYDAGGDVYTSTLAGCDPGLSAVRVTSGKKARGFVTFDIPASSRKLELHYAPTIIGRGPEELKFAIAR